MPWTCAIWSLVPSVSLTQSRPSQSARDMGKKIHSSIIMVLNKIAQQPLHGTTIVPHDGQQSSMMNEKLVQKKPGVDHPIASVDDLGAYEVAHGNFLHKKNQVSSLNKELANDSLYMRSLPQNGICPTESSQAMISLDKFDMRSAVLRFILDIASCQSPLTTGTQPTIERSILLLTMSNLESWAADKGTVVKPNLMAGEMTESKNFSRNFKDTWRLSSVSLCYPVLIEFHPRNVNSMFHIDRCLHAQFPF